MSWTARQGQVGDLRKQSKVELQDLLLRQEKILSNKRLIQTLQDKGKKIRDFAEKICLAIEQHEEEERKQNLLSAARTEFQSKYYKAFTMQQRAVHNTISVSVAGDEIREREGSPVVAHLQKTEPEESVLCPASDVTMETTASGAFLNSKNSQDTELVEALERVTLCSGSSAETKKASNNKATDNYFLKTQQPTKAHYFSVIERTEKDPSPKKPKFKPNQLPSRSDSSPMGSSSPSQSSGTSSPLSAQARKERDRKHLDDITAATLPPLYHSPVQLLSLEESAILLKEQSTKQQELQAKLAAQKLSEGLKISMGSCTPDSGSMAAYREVHDEGAQLSSEED